MAKALLAKYFTSNLKASTGGGSGTRTKIPTDPVKLAQYKKIQLMKMRHRAVPADPKEKLSLPVSERLHIKIPANDDGEDKVFWVKKVGFEFLALRSIIHSNPDNRYREGVGLAC